MRFYALSAAVVLLMLTVSVDMASSQTVGTANDNADDAMIDVLTASAVG